MTHAALECGTRVARLRFSCCWLTLSMRTPGGGVVRGRWGRSLSGGGLSGSLAVGGVAVLACCKTIDRVIMRHGPMSSIEGLIMAGCASVHVTPPSGSATRWRFVERARSGVNRNPARADGPRRSGSKLDGSTVLAGGPQPGWVGCRLVGLGPPPINDELLPTTLSRSAGTVLDVGLLPPVARHRPLFWPCYTTVERGRWR